MTENDLVELSRLFSLWLFALPGESPAARGTEANPASVIVVRH
jgi:hypothetical protein